MSSHDKIEHTLEKWKTDWPAAKQAWNPYIKLREPLWCTSSASSKKEGLSESFAMIRLSDHRIVIDIEKVKTLNLADYSIEILAHEIGHHIYTPANLHDNAILLARIRWGLADIEDRAPFVANIYADLLINDTLQRMKNLQMASVYQQINNGESNSKVWAFVMRTYELLWKLERGSIIKNKDLYSPTIDADAAVASALIRSYSKKWLDGAGRFSALLYPYLMEEKEYEKARKSLVTLLDSENAGEGGRVVSGLAEIDLEGIAEAVDPRSESTLNGGKKSSEINLGEKGSSVGEGPRQRYLKDRKSVV